LNNYDNVLYIGAGGPDNQGWNPGEVFLPWISAGTTEAPHQLAISAQDYGFISGYADTTFPAGSFEYDYLGVMTLGPQDINYDGSAASYEGPYAIDPVEGSLSDWMFDFAGDSLQLFNWPYGTYPGFNNWIDNMTVTDGANVMADFTDPNNGDAPVAIHNSGDGFKTAFWTVDWASLIFYSPTDTASMEYYVVTDFDNYTGFSGIAEFFGFIGAAGAEDEFVTPVSFELGAAYPNPFNPSTSFEYRVASAGDVNITVFNALGQEVATLVEGNKAAGTYMVNWDASSLASGVYFYSMTAPGFKSTQKMLLLK